MDQLRMSPAQSVPVSPSSTFLTSEDLYELLQGRFSSSVSTTPPSTSLGVPDITTRPYSYQPVDGGVPSNQFLTEQIVATQGTSGTLKMELDIGDFMSNSYNWVPTQLYNDSLGCLTYNSNSLAEPPLPEAQVTNNPSTSNQTCPQIQALRDFMVYGNMANPSVASPHPSSTVSSRATTPAASSLFYQLEGAATDSLLRTSGGIGCSSQSSKQPDMSLAYRALCSEIYATDRSPHRSQFQRENHILAERQRREEMNEKFSALRAMIPKATKKDKASIVGDTIDYVLELEKRLKQLQACKDSTAAGAFFKSLKRKTPYGRCDDSTNNDFAAMDAFSKPGGSAPSSDESIQQASGARRPLSSPTREAHSAVSSPSDQVTEESKLPEKKAKADVDVQHLGNQAVIKIVCTRRHGHVLRVLHALEECKVNVLQSNVTTVGNNSIHFVTVELKEGVSASTEELISAVMQGACPAACV